MSKKKSSKSKYFRILGYRVRGTRFYAVAEFILLPPLLFLLVTFAFLQSNNPGGESSSPIQESEVIEEDLKEPENDYTYELLPEEEETSARRIVSTGSSNISTSHTIDLDSGLEVQRSIELSDAEKSNVVKLHLEDPREVDGVVLAHLYRLQINDSEAAEIRVQSVQLNPIIPQWFFTLEGVGDSD